MCRTPARKIWSETLHIPVPQLVFAVRGGSWGKGYHTCSRYRYYTVGSKTKVIFHNRRFSPDCLPKGEETRGPEGRPNCLALYVWDPPLLRLRIFNITRRGICTKYLIDDIQYCCRGKHSENCLFSLAAAVGSISEHCFFRWRNLL